MMRQHRMTIDINRKISFLDKDFALSTASVENILDGIGKSSLAGKSALQFQKFRAAALTLAHFRDQQNGVPAENAPVVSAKDAEAAWKNLSSISKSLSDKVLSDRLNVSISNGEWHTFALFAYADDYEMSGLARLGDEWCLDF